MVLTLRLKHPFSTQPSHRKGVNTFLQFPSFFVSEALALQLVQGFPPGPYHKSFHLCWSESIFAQPGVHCPGHPSCCIPDLLMTLEPLCSSLEEERLQMSSGKVTFPCRRKSHLTQDGSISPKSRGAFTLSWLCRTRAVEGLVVLPF